MIRGISARLCALQLILGLLATTALSAQAQLMAAAGSTPTLAPALATGQPASGQLVATGFDNQPSVWLEDEISGFRTDFSQRQVLPGIQLASSAAPSSPLFNSVLALYSKLVVARQSAIGAWEIERLRAWVSNVRSGQTPAYAVAVDDILELDLDKIHVHALSRQQLLDLGIGANTVAALMPVAALAEKLEGAMMELPQGLQNLPNPMAVAIRGNHQGSSAVVALLLLAS